MRFLVLVTIGLGLCLLGQTQPPPAVRDGTLFLNVRIFDGKSDKLSALSSVLVRGSTIDRVSTSPIDAAAIKKRHG